MMTILFISILALSSCDLKQHHNQSSEHVTEPGKSSQPTSSNPSLPEGRVAIEGTLSKNPRAVVKAAFETDYPATEDQVNAYDFPLYGGNKGMDWWNFPWDLPSSRPEFTITYDDMASLLKQVKVRKTKDSTTFIPYSEMLKDMVLKLNPDIMNAHGGILRVIKIIYCVRNFLAVAIKHNLVDDIASLKIAAQKLIDINSSGKLTTGQSPYMIGSTYNPKNLAGQPEDRTTALGTLELKQMVSQH